MSKGTPALAPTPNIEIAVAAGDTFSIESLMAALNKVRQMQEEETPDATYLAVPCLMENPFSKCTWDIIVAAGNAAGDYQLSFDTEEIEAGTSIGRPALSSRRVVDISVSAAGAFTYPLRSLEAAVNFIYQFEDLVASTGSGTAGDITTTDIAVKGKTPFNEYVWNFNKADDVYILVPTATS